MEKNRNTTLPVKSGERRNLLAGPASLRGYHIQRTSQNKKETCVNRRVAIPLRTSQVEIDAMYQTPDKAVYPGQIPLIPGGSVWEGTLTILSVTFISTLVQVDVV